MIGTIVSSTQVNYVSVFVTIPVAFGSNAEFTQRKHSKVLKNMRKASRCGEQLTSGGGRSSLLLQEDLTQKGIFNSSKTMRSLNHGMNTSVPGNISFNKMELPPTDRRIPLSGLMTGQMSSRMSRIAEFDFPDVDG